MSLAAGSKLGPYEILAPIGAGGMGEVYRAKDPRLGRDVAIKVLPASFATDADRLRRFEQEARAAGVLNHPNITAVYDIGRDGDGAPYVVQELLEGDSLRGVLAGGRLSPRKAIEAALQVAHGLSAAHEKGIVHRDLKPENLFVTRDGRVKILDFGLAKLTHQEEGSQVTGLPTATAGTEPGVVLGTLGYMSPEQVRGRPADARSDIFSFGAILYEMLSGKRAFRGDSAADTMSAILKEDPPDLSVTNQNINPGLERIVRHCLEKNPEQRFHSAHDIAFAIDALSGASGQAATLPTRGSGIGGRALAGGLGLVALLIGLALGRLLAPAPPAPPEIVPFTYSGLDWAPAASPDGKTVAFGSARDGKPRIWLKQIDGGAEVALTEGVDFHPRFSADGASILFARLGPTSRDLYRVATVGGEARRLLADAFEGDWSPDGTRLAFLRGSPKGIQLGVAAADGSGSQIIADFGTDQAQRPRWTPDGKAIVVVQNAGQVTAGGVIQWFSADGTRRRVIKPPQLRGALSSIGWSGGRMVYMQASAATSNFRTATGRVLLQDPDSAKAEILFNVPNFGETLDVVSSGRLAFDASLSSQSLREIPLSQALLPASGRRLSKGRGSDRQPLYSPDGERIIFASHRGNFDVWELILKTGEVRRLTDNPAEDWDPALSPDGKFLLWSSNRTGHFEVWMASADGSDPRLVTHDGVDAENPQMTPDGKWITYSSSGNPQREGLWKIHPDGSGDTRVVPGALVHAEISPSGEYVLFHRAGRQTRVARLDDGKLLPFTIDLKPLDTVGRARWMADGKTLALVGEERETGLSGVYVQEFSPEVADTSATRRRLAGFDGDRVTESFGISRDGSKIVLSEIDEQSDILIANGVPGVDTKR